MWHGYCQHAWHSVITCVPILQTTIDFKPLATRLCKRFLCFHVLIYTDGFQMRFSNWPAGVTQYCCCVGLLNVSQGTWYAICVETKLQLCMQHLAPPSHSLLLCSREEWKRNQELHSFGDGIVVIQSSELSYYIYIYISFLTINTLYFIQKVSGC